MHNSQNKHEHETRGHRNKEELCREETETDTITVTKERIVSGNMNFDWFCSH